MQKPNDILSRFSDNLSRDLEKIKGIDSAQELIKGIYNSNIDQLIESSLRIQAVINSRTKSAQQNNVILDDSQENSLYKNISENSLINIKKFTDAVILTKFIFSITNDRENSKRQENFTEALKGAHIIVDNNLDHSQETDAQQRARKQRNQQIYNKLKQIGKERPSSHHKTANKNANPDFSINAGFSFKECLFGLTADGDLWFQLERTPLKRDKSTENIFVSILKDIIDFIATILLLGVNIVKGFSPIEAILHGIDFLEYKYKGENIGQYGTSAHIDSNPMILGSLDNIGVNNDITIKKMIDDGILQMNHEFIAAA